MTIITGSVPKIPKGSAIFQYLAAFSGTINIITSGMHYGWPSPSLPKLQAGLSGFPVSGSEGSWMAVMPLIGSILGSIIVGSTVDIFGRKRTILIASIPFFAAWIMVAYAPNVKAIYLARFIAGIADGWVFTAVPMYIGEIASPKIRGFLGSSVSVTWIFGILLINIIGAYFSVSQTALISSVFPLMTVLTFSFMPESPYYLLMRTRTETAKRNLQKLRGLLDVEAEFERIQFAVSHKTSSKSDRSGFFDLFRDRVNRKAIFVMMILRGTQQLSGTTAFTFYAQSIFIEAGDHVSSEIASIIYFSVQFLLACGCSTIVDRAGRRPLLIISLIGASVFLLIEGIYFYLKTCTLIDISSFSLVPVVALIGFVIIFSGMTTIPVLMLGELFSSNIKAFALCYADIYFSIFATIISKFFQIMKDSIGIYAPFFEFSLNCLIGLVLIVLFVPETKGKTLEEIQAHFKGSDKEKEVNNNA